MYHDETATVSIDTLIERLLCQLIRSMNRGERNEIIVVTATHLLIPVRMHRISHCLGDIVSGWHRTVYLPCSEWIKRNDYAECVTSGFKRIWIIFQYTPQRPAEGADAWGAGGVCVCVCGKDLDIETMRFCSAVHFTIMTWKSNCKYARYWTCLST